MSTTWHQLLRKTWRDVTRQIDITLRHHERQDYGALYEEVQTVSSRVRVHVPTWIPGTGDVPSLKWAAQTQYKAGLHLLQLHRDLQKFELQREVEKALVNLEIGVPTSHLRASTSIQPLTTKPAARMPRDRAVLNRYRNYLQQWVRLWRAGVTRRRRVQRNCYVVGNETLQIV